MDEEEYERMQTNRGNLCPPMPPGSNGFWKLRPPMEADLPFWCPHKFEHAVAVGMESV